jgi:hypothetical protein
MAEDKAPDDQVRTMMAKNLEQARGAMTNYFQFLEDSMSTLYQISAIVTR